MWKRIGILVIVILGITLMGAYAMNKNSVEEGGKKAAIEFMKKETGKTFVPKEVEWAPKAAGKLMFIQGYYKEDPAKKLVSVDVFELENGKYRPSGWGEEGDVDHTNYELQNELEKIE